MFSITYDKFLKIDLIKNYFFNANFFKYFYANFKIAIINFTITSFSFQHIFNARIFICFKPNRKYTFI